VGANPNRAARITTAAATTRQLLADRAAIEAADRSTDTVPVDSLQLFDRSGMRGTIAMRDSTLAAGAAPRPKWDCA